MTKYAVLISGDWAESGFDEFWNDVVLMREMLLANNFEDQNIFILYANGNDFVDSTRTYARYDPVAINRPSRPNRPSSFTDYPATKAEVQAFFAGLANGDNVRGIPKMTENDFLFVWTFDHGGTAPGGHSTLCLWGIDIQDDEFASAADAIPCCCRVFCMQQCHSGGFIDDLSNDKTILLTACRGDEFAQPANNTPTQEDEIVNGVTYNHGEFNYHLISALLQQAVNGGAPVNADTTGNGFVSMLEVFNYVEAHDNRPEHPQYDDGPNNIGGDVHIEEFPDIFMRDNFSDTGAVPTSGCLCQSPDIIVRNDPIQPSDIDAELGDPSVMPPSDTVEYGQDNYVYVRLHNRANIEGDAKVDVYYSPVSSFASPSSWNLIGSIDVSDVSPSSMKVTGPIIWGSATVPSPGHYCFIGVLDSLLDPAPDPAEVPLSGFLNFIRNNNNVVWKNFNVADAIPDGYGSFKFKIQGGRGAYNSDLEVDKTNLPAGMEIKIKLLRRLTDRATLVGMKLERQSTLYRAYKVPVKKGQIKNMPLKSRDSSNAVVYFHIPKNAPEGQYSLTIAQMMNGAYLGAFTHIFNTIPENSYSYMGNRKNYRLHKKGCPALERLGAKSKTPFKDIGSARRAGYDYALCCMNVSFGPKEVSHRLEKKVLRFVNSVRSPKTLSGRVKDTLGIGYFRRKYVRTWKKGIGLILPTAEAILEKRKKIDKFTSLEQIDAVKGVGKDTFVDLVNSFN